jgi:hypothetical protein
MSLPFIPEYSVLILRTMEGVTRVDQNWVGFHWTEVHSVDRHGVTFMSGELFLHLFPIIRIWVPWLIARKRYVLTMVQFMLGWGPDFQD